MTAAVVACRLLTATEGAVAGETLWIVQFTLLTLLVWVFAAFRNEGLRGRLDWIDAGLGLMVLGQFVAALVNRSQSDGRALVNMVWEWCGLLVTWFLLRRVVAQPAARRSLTVAILALVASLSGFGIWQHYVSLPETRREVTNLQSEWDALQTQGRPADPSDASDYDERLQFLRLEFVRQGIPTEGSSRMLWDQRLQSSSEPYGLFGLANTFAGLLVAGLVLWMGLAAATIRGGAKPGSALALAAVCLLIAYCLVLTKSRTAYVGLLVGLAFAAVALRTKATSPRALWMGSAALVVSLSLLAGLAALTGGLDSLVLSESFKSLRYRGEYWVGTWRMLTADVVSWLAGVGPGNFRPHYLQFKLPQSSEEIAEPHNLILDIWANGGLVALAGLGLLLAAGTRPLWRRASITSPPETVSPPTLVAATTRNDAVTRASRWRDPVLIGTALAFGLVFLVGGLTDARILVLGCGWMLALAIVPTALECELPVVWFGAAFMSLTVHLLGAGGISMPAITQTLFWLVAVGATDSPPRAWFGRLAARWAGFVGAAAAFALYVGCWMSATIPVMQAANDLSAGEQALYEEGRFDKGERAYRQAAEADPLGAEACERLAELYLQRWLSTRDDDDFERSLNWQNKVLARQPRNMRGYRRLGATYLARFDRTKNRDDAARAADEFARAVDLYPTHVELLSELAEAYWSAGQVEAARRFADRAAELDAINHQAGHVDKWLSSERLQVLETIREP